MKKSVKKLIALALALAMVLTLAACGGNNGSGASGSSNSGDSGSTNTGSDNSGSDGASEGQSAAVEPKKVKIGVAHYSDYGAAYEAIVAYLESMSSTLNVEFVYATLTQTDESANLTKIQELIASGVDGILCSMDMGMGAIMDECEAAGVYLAGFLADYDDSYNNNYDMVFGSEYFLGTVADGPITPENRRGDDFAASLIEYNDAHPDERITHVAMTMFPGWAFPTAPINVQQFIDAIDEYNAANPENAITVDPLDEASDVLMFTNVDSTYFSKHSGIQAIIAFNAGQFVFPTMVSAGVEKDIKLFCSGWNDGDEQNFGSHGTGTYQSTVVCATESINYPLVLLLNKLNGVEFSDQPAEAERVSCVSYIINSDEDLARFERNVYLTGDAKDAIYTPEDVLNMTAFGNPNATYADLVETLNHMTIDDLK